MQELSKEYILFYLYRNNIINSMLELDQLLQYLETNI